MAGPCSIDGCLLPSRSRGWCTKHWTRWRRYGDPAARIPGEVVAGRRVCPGCGQDKPLAEWGRSACRPCVNERMRRRRAARPRRRPQVPVVCATCGGCFDGDARRRKFCSSDCAWFGKIEDGWEREVDAVAHAAAVRGWSQRNQARRWANEVARRARKRSAVSETVDRIAVFERDGWCCQLCGEPIDAALRHPDPMSASVDHRVPLVAGGPHTMANCQAAHLVCNGRKGAAVEPGLEVAS